MEPEQERGDDAEVATAAAQRPEEIGVLRLARRDEGAIGQHDVGLEQIVDGQAELPGEVTESSAQGDAPHPGGGDNAGRRCQPESVGGVVQIAEQCAPLDTGGARLQIDPHPVHPGQVDHQPVVDEAETRPVVTAAADGHDDVVVAREVDRSDHIGDGLALSDERRPLVDHRVIDRTDLVIVRITGLDEIAAHSGGQTLDGCFVEGRGELDRRCHELPPCFVARDTYSSRVLPGLALECIVVLHRTSAGLRISGANGRVAVSVILTVPAKPTQSRPRLSARVAASRRLATSSLLRMCAT